MHSLPLPRPTGTILGMRGYSLVSLTIGVFYVAAVLAAIGGISIGAWLWSWVDEVGRARAAGLPVPALLAGFAPADLTSNAVVFATGGVSVGLFFGFVAQLLSMLRNQAVDSAKQVQLLRELVALHEQEMSAIAARRVAPCEGCGKLAGVERLESGQWVCVECRRAVRTA